MPTPGINKDYLDASLRGAIKEIVGHFNKSHGVQNERLNRLDRRLGEQRIQLGGIERHFPQIDGKLDALFEEVSTRRELHNLVAELKTRGIRLDESRIFVTPPRG